MALVWCMPFSLFIRFYLLSIYMYSYAVICTHKMVKAKSELTFELKVNTSRGKESEDTVKCIKTGNAIYHDGKLV